MLKDRYFNGIIPAGTPMAQIVMIKRESWKMGFGDKKDLRKQYKDQVALRSLLFNSYKKLFWKRKEFR